jgi:hypothetical protein
MSGQGKVDSPVAASGQDVDHRNDGTEGPIKDQGQVGACTSFSLSTAMDNAIRRQNKNETISSIHIWSHYGFPDMRTAGDDNLNKVITVWDVWPYDERIACEIDQSGDGDCGPYTPAVTPGAAGHDAKVQAKIKDSDSKGHWKVTAYDEIEGNPDTIAQYLQTGADVWMSMNIGSTWMTVSGDTVADWTAAQVEGATPSSSRASVERTGNVSSSSTTVGARTGGTRATRGSPRDPSRATSSMRTR